MTRASAGTCVARHHADDAVAFDLDDDLLDELLAVPQLAEADEGRLRGRVAGNQQHDDADERWSR